MSEDALTTSEQWNSYWEDMDLPRETTRTRRASVNNAILDVLDAALPKGEGVRTLELGGAPGQYLAYMQKNYGHQVSALDYSSVGCEMTRRNFDLLGRSVTVHQKDLLRDDLSDLEPYDIVFSLGLIEHFSDLDLIVGKHTTLLKKGGTLVLGVPNLSGVYEWPNRRLAPQRLAEHNLTTMKATNWAGFETRYGLEVLFKDYIGGFEPRTLNHCERYTPLNTVLYGIVKGLIVLSSLNLNVLRRVNSSLWSGYLLAVYRYDGT